MADELGTCTPTFLRRLQLARRAFEFARRAHWEQRRESDAARFIIHPLEVAATLHNTAHAEDLVAAGILHDTVENSDTSVEAIRAEFGERIAALVDVMSEDPAIEDFEKRKAAQRDQIASFGPDAVPVFAADKVAKMRELRSLATRGADVLDPANGPARAKLEHYLASLSMLEEISPEHPLVRQLRFELEILRALPPRPELVA